MSYDFKNLSAYDFEMLCCDLLTEVFSMRFESFKVGKDKGIDLRYISNAKETVIVQCKRFVDSKFSQLENTIKNELKKVEKLEPERYILVTSLHLNPHEKQTLYDILQPYCKSESDIIGNDELNSYLRAFPNIEKANYKLWLTSTAVLEKILKSEVYNRSEFAIEEIHARLQIYVQSQKAYSKAHEMLKQFNCCVISGIPGIGKTTLAEILLIYFLDNGYQVYKISNDISEAITVYNQEEKQVFLYDDFLGSTSLETKLNKNESKDLLSFMNMVSKQKNKKFILTTREYILYQAQQTYEELSRHDFSLNNCVIALEDYTKFDRAKILYNHLYFNKIPSKCILDILDEDKILHIIEHKNYNPRLIGIIAERFSKKHSTDFYTVYMNALNNPKDIWKHAFEKQISRQTQDLMFLLTLFDSSISIDVLEELYESYHMQKTKRENISISGNDFYYALKEAEGTFIVIERQKVSFHNPSVRDFMQGYIFSHDYEFKALCEGCITYEQCLALFNLSRHNGDVLCHKYKEIFIMAIKKTIWYLSYISYLFPLTIFRAGGYATDSYANRILSLIRINKILCFSEIETIITNDYFGTLHNKIEDYYEQPSSYVKLLEELQKKYSTQLTGKKAIQSIYSFFANWFCNEYSYYCDDFIAVFEIQKLIKINFSDDKWKNIKDAFIDYKDNIASDEVDEISNDEDAVEFEDKINILGTLFDIDVKAIQYNINYRLGELQQETEDEEAEEGLNPWEINIKMPWGEREVDKRILHMFRSFESF